MKKIIFTILLGAWLLPGINFAQNRFREKFEEIKAGDNFYTIQKELNDYYAEHATGQGSGYKQYKRWEDYMAPRVYPSGKIMNIEAKVWEEYFAYEDNAKKGDPNTTFTHSGYWSFVGPTTHVKGNSGYNGGVGRVNCIARHPTLASNIFVGTPSGGIWKSTTSGNAWTSLSDGIPRLGVSGIVVISTNTIYILTGDGDGSDTYSVGVLKTTNGGVTWKKTGLSFTPTDYVKGYKLMVDPTNSSILYAVTTNGLYKTTNAGTSWTLVKSGSFRDCEFKPGTPATLYLVSTTTFYLSTDAGATWVTGAVGLPTSGSNRIAIGVSANNTAYVYLLYGKSTGFMGLYRSFDSGLNFGLKSSTPNILGYDIAGGDFDSQSSYDLAIAVDPSNVGNVIIGGINTWRSTDFGATWTNSSYWVEDATPAQYTHADIHALEYFGTSLYCGSDGGIYRSLDKGVIWADRSTGLGITQFYNLGLLQSNSAKILGGAQDNGSNQLNGATFTHFYGADGFEVAYRESTPTTLFIESQNGGIRRSTNSGSTFTSIVPPGATGAGWNTPYIIDPANDARMYIGYDKCYRSTNSGTAWTQIGGSLGTGVDLTACPSNSSRLYYATSSKVWRSDNCTAAAPTFTNVTGTLPVASASITSITVDNTNSLNAFVSFSGFSAANKVFETIDGGVTWTNISTGLPNIPVNCILYHNGSADGIYVGTDVGVYYRDDALGTWIPFMNGLPNVIVRELEIHTSTNQLVAATYGRGFWKSDTYSGCPSGYSLSTSNYQDQGYFYFEASSSISSSMHLYGGTGTDCNYNAGSYIDLVDGFEITDGSLLHAYIDGCTGTSNPFPIQKLSGSYAGPMDDKVEDILQAQNQSFKIDDFELYPVPVRNTVNVSYTLNDDSPLKISVVGIDGKQMNVLMNQSDMKAGVYRLNFDTSNLNNGIYFMRIETKAGMVTKRFSKVN